MAKAATLSRQGEAETKWTSTQAYVLAVFCLVLGVALGYLFRGSASQGVETAAADNQTAQGMPAAAPNPEQQKAMLDRAAAPLLDIVKKNPADADTFIKLGNLYFDGRGFPEAIKYYEAAVKLQPNNADVRTDLGTAYWYMNDADKALLEFQKSLKSRPNHASTLYNMGVVKWQGKMDPAGAVSAWEQLLKTNPSYPQRQQVEELISRAKQHAKG